MQEKARRTQRMQIHGEDELNGQPLANGSLEAIKEKVLPEVPKQPVRPLSAESTTRPAPPASKSRSNLSNFSSRLTSGVGVKKTKR